MARKRLPLSKLSRTARYYRTHPKAAAKKKKYDTKYHSTPERKAYRAELGRERRKRGIMGKGGGDLHHSKKGLVREPVKKNRGRNEKSRRKNSKRKRRD